MSTTILDNNNNSNKNDNSRPPLNLGDLGVGLMQWGTTDIDNKVVNPKGNLSEEEVRNIWKTCRKNHLIFFDTAEGYGGGTSETRIRGVQNWYKDQEEDDNDDNNNNNNNNNKIIIATKFLPTLWRWTKGSFYKSLHGSLDRLGVSCIDLYFIHTPIHPLPIEYFIQWACDAVDDGLIQEIGISNCNAELVKRSHAVAVRNNKRIACNQIMLNMLVWQSKSHQETVQTCHDLGITIAAYSPIGQGLLTDGLSESKFQSIRAVRMTGVQYPDLSPLRKEIAKICEEQRQRQHQNNNNDDVVSSSCTMAQVAINWVRGHGAVPLIGCRSVSQVEDAIGSLKWKLTSEEVERLDRLSLGLSLFERPMHRRCLFVIFISLLQLAYYTEQRYKKLKAIFSTTTTAGTAAAPQKQKQNDDHSGHKD